MNGRASPSSPGPTCAPPREAGASPRTFRTFRPGSSRRSAARPRTGPAPRCASTSTSSRTRAPTATSPAPTCWTGRSRSPRWSRGTPRPRTRWASPAPTAFRDCPATTISRCWKPARKKLGYKEVHTGNMAINSAAARRTRRLPADRLLLPGLQVGREMVDALYRDSQGRGDRQSRGAPQQHGDQDRARRVRQGHRRGLCRRERRDAAPEGARGRGRGQLDREPAAAAQQRLDHVPGRPCQLVRARSAATTCGT